MENSEINKAKKTLVNLLNSLFSKFPDYRMEYDYNDTGILINLVDEENALPLVNSKLISTASYEIFIKASKYFPQAMSLWRELDIIFLYNGNYISNTPKDSFVGDSLLECFETSIKEVQSKPIKFDTAFINIGPKMGEFYITAVNNTITKTDIDPSDNYIYFFTYLIPDYLLLSNDKGQSVKVTAESLREFYLNGGEDGEKYDFTPEEILEALLRAITFAQTEQHDTEVSKDFYNCLSNTFNWDDGIYMDYFPLYELLILGINDMVISDWGVFGEANTRDFEIFEDLFNFLLRK